MGQAVRGVALELDALLEVHEVKLDLLGLHHRARLVMMTWNRVDLPEPVLPAIKACWRVPLPMARYWNLVAPVRPMGTRNSLVVLSSLQISLARRGDLLEGDFDATGVAAALLRCPTDAETAGGRSIQQQFRAGGGGSSLAEASVHARSGPRSGVPTHRVPAAAWTR
jgi:hypothetical protein